MNDAAKGKARPRVAVVAHVGYAKSHLLRAIAIHESLSESFDSLLVVPEKSRDFFQQFFPNTPCEWVNWFFSHNDVFDLQLSEIVSQLRITVLDLHRIFDTFSPDIVIGIPGFQSSSICRALGIPHISVLHGPWLVPEYKLSDLRPGEKAVFGSWERAIELTDTLSNVVAHALGQKYEGYLDWLEKEDVWIAQDFDVEYKNERPRIGFLHTDFGPSVDRGLPRDCLTLSLGTAIDDDKAEILNALSAERLPRLIVGGPEVPVQPETYWRSALAGTSLADISSIAVCHGGIGTIPVFADGHVPQIFVPHDLDQAVNAVLAQRSGLGASINLDYWKQRTPFGRIRPRIRPSELRQLVRGAAIGSAARTSNSNDRGTIQSLVREACN